MHYSYNTYIPFFLFFLIISTMATGNCDEETQKIVIQSDPYLLYGKIDIAKDTAFGQDAFIKNGLTKTNLKSWDTLLDCCHLAVFNLIEKSKAPKKYEEYSAQLSSINDFTKHIINELHKKYAWLFDTKDSALLLKKLTRSFTDDDRLYLDGLRNEIMVKNKILANIIGISLKEINGEKTTPNQQVTIPSSLEEILPCYKEFFNSYVQAKKGTSSSMLRTNELVYFLTITNVFSEKCLKGAYKNDVEKAAALVDVLETVNLYLEQESKKSKLNNEQRKMLTANNEIITGLFNLFPQMITNKTFKQLPLTHDKASIIIFAEAKALLTILEGILQEIKQLLSK